MSDKPRASWRGPALFLATLAAVVLFFWWLLLAEHGPPAAH